MGQMDQAAERVLKSPAQRIASIIASCDNDEICAERILREVVHGMITAAYSQGGTDCAQRRFRIAELYADETIEEALKPRKP